MFTIMANDSSQLATLIEQHCEREGIAPSTFGQRHFKNPRLHTRLLNGGSITMTTYEKLMAILQPPEAA